MSESTSNKRSKKPLCSLRGNPIPAARLEALPGVTTCLECAKKNPPRIDVKKYDLSESSPIDRTGFARSD
jgi:RNA polymerase-binding transcription factor DksA